MNEKFAVLIPVYNKENNVEKIADKLDILEVRYIFVDDGSTDKTMTNLWMKDIPALCYYPRRGNSFAIQLGVKYLVNEGYNWILVMDKVKKYQIEDIEKLDNALFWNEDKCKIFITKSGTKLLHKDIFSQIKSYWFDFELRWKIKWLKWQVISC